MFTGIVPGLGEVTNVNRRSDFLTLEVDIKGLFPAPKIGASVAVNGVCLTATKVAGDRLTFDVMAETIAKTTLGELAIGEAVCLEPSAKVGDEIGGHIVLGHVDGVGMVSAIERDGENCKMSFVVAADLAPYLVQKGSIAIDGISLTVCDPSTTESEASFDVWLLPLTLERTTLGRKQVGDKVNVESDYLLKAIVKTPPVS